MSDQAVPASDAEGAAYVVALLAVAVADMDCPAPTVRVKFDVARVGVPPLTIAADAQWACATCGAPLPVLAGGDSVAFPRIVAVAPVADILQLVVTVTHPVTVRVVRHPATVRVVGVPQVVTIVAVTIVAVGVSQRIAATRVIFS